MELRFCAHEFEKIKDMATAALAYKCVEVAYLRVVYSSHNTASRDRHELQTALQMVPPGMEYASTYDYLFLKIILRFFSLLLYIFSISWDFIMK